MSRQCDDRRRSRWLVIVAGLALVAGGCRTGDGAPATAPVVEPPHTPGALVVEAREFRYDRSSWTVPAGRPARIDFSNRGTIPHEWAVLRRAPAIEWNSEFREEMVLLEVEAIPEGTTGSQVFEINEPGDYQVVCVLPGHLDAGMTSTLHVTAPDPL